MEISKPIISTNYKLNDGSTDDDKQCRLRFIDCHKKHPLYKLNNQDLKSFIEFAKKVEQQTWKSIKFEDKGLNYETLDSVKLPENSHGHIYCESMRVTQKFRILGYRDTEYFYIVWFDNKHEEC